MQNYLRAALIVTLFMPGVRNVYAQSTCDAGKVKCVSKRVGCLMKVKANALKKGEPDDQGKLQKCFDKFDGGSDPAKGCFAKLEAKQTLEKPHTLCSTGGDSSAVAADADILTNSLVQAVSTPSVAVSGATRNYFTGAAVDTVELSRGDGVAELLDTSDGSGLFAFTTAGNRTLLVDAARGSYHTTRNVGIELLEEAVMTDFEAVAFADAARQFATTGEVSSADTGLVFIEMVDGNGTPIEGVPLGDIELLDGGGFPSADGPFFFGAGGDMVPGGSLPTSTAFGGRARVGFLNCPPGTHDLTVVTVSQNYFATIECIADAVTLAQTEE
jgi:hypothetical protein